jgi:hypothetical protein
MSALNKKVKRKRVRLIILFNRKFSFNFSYLFSSFYSLVMEKINFVFQTDSKEIALYFRNSPNYLIEYESKDDQEQRYCVLYFSSNDLYNPNIAEAFNRQVVRTNKFEWYRTRVNRATKHIFLRDIKKQWYLNGINEELNSIEKLFAFLKIETAGFKTIALGS